MISDEVQEKLQNIVTGTVVQGQHDRCAAIRNLLLEGFGASPTLKNEFESRAIIKKEQDQFLRSYAEKRISGFQPCRPKVNI
jgi:hypothetical protein